MPCADTSSQPPLIKPGADQRGSYRDVDLDAVDADERSGSSSHAVGHIVEEVEIHQGDATAAYAGARSGARSRRTITLFDVGVLLMSATLSRGTRTLVSG
ncbi:hypothetical protein GCM10010276_32800 [Streptomyces longisporus]|uniref:Uncharacterized protein n=1 Tax=Streptomyces longisporus TaxID=1948 RepID=A0ABP5Z254_STRLO